MLSCMICVSLSLICIHYHEKLDLKKSATTYGTPCTIFITGASGAVGQIVGQLGELIDLEKLR